MVQVYVEYKSINRKGKNWFDLEFSHGIVLIRVKNDFIPRVNESAFPITFHCDIDSIRVSKLFELSTVYKMIKRASYSNHRSSTEILPKDDNNTVSNNKI